MNTYHLKIFLKSFLNIHIPNKNRKDVFIFSTPRSGSTWLQELINSQPGYKSFSEPFNLRNPYVRKYLGINSWTDLYNESSLQDIKRYMYSIQKGEIDFGNPSPFRKNYSFISRNIAFKIIHGCEDRINWFSEAFNGSIVYLLRHPIPVALSREIHPRLKAFVTSDFKRFFSIEQLEYANRIIDSGSMLQKGMLSWCLQNSVPLNHKQDNWVILSYEQLVLQPKKVVPQLCKKLNLQHPERMLEIISLPSATAKKSKAARQRLLTSKSKTSLVNQWRQYVSGSQENELMDMLSIFNIGAYQAGQDMPTSNFII